MANEDTKLSPASATNPIGTANTVPQVGTSQQQSGKSVRQKNGSTRHALFNMACVINRKHPVLNRRLLFFALKDLHQDFSMEFVKKVTLAILSSDSSRVVIKTESSYPCSLTRDPAEEASWRPLGSVGQYQLQAQQLAEAYDFVGERPFQEPKGSITPKSVPLSKPVQDMLEDLGKSGCIAPAPSISPPLLLHR